VITLTREQLYERVWQTPSLHLCKEFGLSDAEQLPERVQKRGNAVIRDFRGSTEGRHPGNQGFSRRLLASRP
jgi:hypothetical protein